jgi:hypothetical protein
MGIEKGEQVENSEYVIKKKKKERKRRKEKKTKFPNLEKRFPFRYRKHPGHQTDMTEIELHLA